MMKGSEPMIIRAGPAPSDDMALILRTHLARRPGREHGVSRLFSSVSARFAACLALHDHGDDEGN